MNKSLLTILAASATLAMVQSASAVELTAWDVDGIDLDDLTTPYTINGTTAANIASSALTLSGTVNNSTSINQSGFKIAVVDQQTSLSGAITAGHYFQFTLTASPGFVLNLTSIEMNGGSSGTGADGGAFLSNLGGGFTAGSAIASTTGKQGVTGGFDTDASGFGGPINLSAATFQGISSVTFRFYGWDTTSASGVTNIRSLSGNDLIINGDVAAVPEPQTYALIIGGLIVTVIFARRRRANA